MQPNEEKITLLHSLLTFCKNKQKMFSTIIDEFKFVEA